MNIAWDHSLSTGIAEIDAQHKDLLHHFHRLQKVCRRHLSKEMVLRCLQVLEKFSEYHFLSEENMLLLLRYPQIEIQREENRKFMVDLRHKLSSFEEGVEEVEALNAFLGTRLLSHIQAEERTIGEFMAAKGSA